MKQTHFKTFFNLIICGLVGTLYFINQAQASVCNIVDSDCGFGVPLSFAPLSCPVTHPNSVKPTCTPPQTTTQSGACWTNCTGPTCSGSYPNATQPAACTGNKISKQDTISSCWSNCACDTSVFKWCDCGVTTPGSTPCPDPKIPGSNKCDGLADSCVCPSSYTTCPNGPAAGATLCSDGGSSKYSACAPTCSGSYPNATQPTCTIPGQTSAQSGSCWSNCTGPTSPDPCVDLGLLYSGTGSSECNGLFGMVKDPSSPTHASCSGKYSCIRNDCQTWAVKEKDKGFIPQEVLDGTYFCDVKVDCVAGEAGCPWKLDGTSGREYLDNTQNQDCSKICRGEDRTNCTGYRFEALTKYNYGAPLTFGYDWEMLFNPHTSNKRNLTCAEYIKDSSYLEAGAGGNIYIEVTSSVGNDVNNGKYVSSDHAMNVEGVSVEFTRKNKNINPANASEGQIKGFFGAKTKAEIDGGGKVKRFNGTTSSGILFTNTYIGSAWGIPICYGNCQFDVETYSNNGTFYCSKDNKWTRVSVPKSASHCTAIEHIIDGANSGQLVFNHRNGGFYGTTARPFDIGNNSSPFIIRGKDRTSAAQTGMVVTRGNIDIYKVTLDNAGIEVSAASKIAILRIGEMQFNTANDFIKNQGIVYLKSVSNSGSQAAGNKLTIDVTGSSAWLFNPDKQCMKGEAAAQTVTVLGSNLATFNGFVAQASCGSSSNTGAITTHLGHPWLLEPRAGD